MESSIALEVHDSESAIAMVAGDDELTFNHSDKHPWRKELQLSSIGKFDKSLSYNADLSADFSTISNPAIHKCEQCSAVFAAPEHLKYHECLHADGAAYDAGYPTTDHINNIHAGKTNAILPQQEEQRDNKSLLSELMDQMETDSDNAPLPSLLTPARQYQKQSSVKKTPKCPETELMQRLGNNIEDLPCIHSDDDERPAQGKVKKPITCISDSEDDVNDKVELSMRGEGEDLSYLLNEDKPALETHTQPPQETPIPNHTGPCKCQVCNKDFTSADELKYHVSVHTDVKP